jgi:hypothetical protein
VKTTIVLVNGKAGSGKDTVCEFLEKELNSRRVRTFIVGNADAVRRLARNAYGWNDVKDDKGRQLLIDITNAGYNYDPYFWERESKETVNRYSYVGLTPKDTVILVNDWRYKNTYDFWGREQCRVITIRVSRGVEKCTPYAETIKNDKSEVGLDNFCFEHFILNDGSLEDLYKSLTRVLGEI